jgi:hypothetical protein
MFRLFSFSLLVLSGCGMSTVHFREAPVTRISVDSSVFDVRVRGNLAEAIRVNPQYAPRLGPIRGRAALAMARVSGCRVTDVHGDQALATGVLDCGQRMPNWTPPANSGSYSCIDLSQRVNKAPGRVFVEYDCDPASG